MESELTVSPLEERHKKGMRILDDVPAIAQVAPLRALENPRQERNILTVSGTGQALLDRLSSRFRYRSAAEPAIHPETFRHDFVAEAVEEHPVGCLLGAAIRPAAKIGPPQLDL